MTSNELFLVTNVCKLFEYLLRVTRLENLLLFCKLTRLYNVKKCFKSHLYYSGDYSFMDAKLKCGIKQYAKVLEPD